MSADTQNSSLYLVEGSQAPKTETIKVHERALFGASHPGAPNRVVADSVRSLGNPSSLLNKKM